MEESNNSVSPKQKGHSDFQIILFILILCFGSGLILALASYSLSATQQAAKLFDQSKQMLIAAKILDYSGTFGILDKKGTLVAARFDSHNNILVAVEEGPAPKATEEEIKTVAEIFIRPLLADDADGVYTFEEKHLSVSEYLEENKKEGYAKLPYKIFYVILRNEKNAREITAETVAKDLAKGNVFIFPVSGFGLWAPIYGYLAVGEDGETVVGTTWYDHAETPGLGANITEPWWQKQFYGKRIFQGEDLKTADMGIIVVKGRVKDVYGTSQKSKSAVDGMSGATLTGDGVTQAYRNSLNPYRRLLQKIHELFTHGKKSTN